jgi:ATP-dependent DNA helicase RecG
LNDRLALGTVPVVIGTQALLSGDVEFARLGMVIIDEQHKFGVMQRAQLVAKGDRPNVLVLTATPIPRSLALTLYGDLDVSLLRERPHGAGQVTTRAVTPDARAAAYRDAAGFMPPRGVAYVVCPRLAEGSDDKAGVHALHDEIRRELSPHWPLAKMHGQTPAPERAKILRDVDRGAVRAIVATSVIEVGLDLPNATVLIVENAESFGLSQLHQMRGRIGRQGQPALCLLIAGPDCSPEALERLQFLCSTHDGFAVAERDLQLRGPGEMLGARQSGLPNLRFARQALADPELVEQARSAAAKILDQDPNLSHPEHHWARMVTVQRWAALLGDGACG